MEALIPILIFGTVVVLIAGGIWWGSYLGKKRREAFESSAHEMGLSFYPHGKDDLMSSLAGFQLFSRGRARKMNNLVEGVTDEVRIAIFDYQYTTGSGRSQTTTAQTVAALQSPQLGCPDFSMRPESVFDRVGGMLGFQDIDFESHPEFSRLFVLKGSDEEAVRTMFTPSLLEYFESRPGISVEGFGQNMCFFRSGKKVPPDKLKELLADAYEVFGHLADA